MEQGIFMKFYIMDYKLTVSTGQTMLLCPEQKHTSPNMTLLRVMLVESSTRVAVML